MTATSAAPTPGAALPAATVQVDIISIQSQVVYGCVGNNAAMPVFRGRLARAGRAHRDPEQHAALSDAARRAVPMDWFDGLLQGLEDRGVTRVARAVVCGYLGQPARRTRWRAGCRCAPPGPTSRCISIRSWATATTGCT